MNHEDKDTFSGHFSVASVASQERGYAVVFAAEGSAHDLGHALGTIAELYIRRAMDHPDFVQAAALYMRAGFSEEEARSVIVEKGIETIVRGLRCAVASGFKVDYAEPEKGKH